MVYQNNVNEDVNRDGSIIFLGSNEHKLPFIPGTVNDKNIGDFVKTQFYLTSGNLT